MNSLVYYAAVAAAMFHRDFYVYRKNAFRYYINYGICGPLALITAFGYLIPHTAYADPSVRLITQSFIGSILWVVQPLAFTLNVKLLLDFEHDKFITYQLGLMRAPLVILQKILFCAFIVFCTILTYFPLAKLILGQSFDWSHVSGMSVLGMLASCALFCASYNLFTVCFVARMKNVENFWIRCNFTLMQLGGFLVPWYAMNCFSPLLGKALLFNPFLYISEGLRYAFLADPLFIPASTCITRLIIASFVFYLLACYYARKKTDHV